MRYCYDPFNCKNLDLVFEKKLANTPTTRGQQWKSQYQLVEPLV